MTFLVDIRLIENKGEDPMRLIADNSHIIEKEYNIWYP